MYLHSYSHQADLYGQLKEKINEKEQKAVANKNAISVQHPCFPRTDIKCTACPSSMGQGLF